MDIDKKTAKLIGVLVSIHIAAGTLGIVSGIFYGVLAGLTIFTISIIILPLLINYLYFSNRSNEKGKKI